MVRALSYCEPLGIRLTEMRGTMTSPAAELPDTPAATAASARRRRPNWPIAILLILLVAGGAVGAWAALYTPYHFAVVQDGVLYRSGNKNLRQFKAGLERGHIRTIVALIDDKELADPTT